MTWYKNPNILPMDSDKGRRKSISVSFSTPPACHTLRLEAAGILKARLDGLPADCRRLQGNRYEIQAPRKRPGSQKVELTLSAHEGELAAAALLSFVDCLCDTGEIETGDWGETDGLRFYSGGLRYGKQVELPALKQGERALLHLGEVSAAASVEVNGRPAGDLVAPPFRLDITPYVEAGENILSVTVYNTLYNHYRTIPTKYNGRAQKSGLLGPVQIEICKGEED